MKPIIAVASKTHTLQAQLQELIREDRRILSTGAYGDEGGILLLFEERIFAGSNGAAGRDLTSSLLRPVEELPACILEPLRSLAKDMVDAWTPLRWQKSEDQAQSLGDFVWGQFRVYRLRNDISAEAQMAFMELEVELIQAIRTRQIFSLKRGADAWRMLHEMDLLAPLGGFLRETE